MRKKISSIKAYKHWLIACSDMPYIIHWWLLFPVSVLIALRRERNVYQNPNDENSIRTASGITAYKWWYSIAETTHKRISDSPDGVTRSQSDHTNFRRTFRATFANVRTQEITYIGSDVFCVVTLSVKFQKNKTAESITKSDTMRPTVTISNQRTDYRALSDF